MEPLKGLGVNVQAWEAEAKVVDLSVFVVVGGDSLV